MVRTERRYKDLAHIASYHLVSLCVFFFYIKYAKTMVVKWCVLSGHFIIMRHAFGVTVYVDLMCVRECVSCMHPYQTTCAIVHSHRDAWERNATHVSVCRIVVHDTVWLVKHLFTAIWGMFFCWLTNVWLCRFLLLCYFCVRWLFPVAAQILVFCISVISSVKGCLCYVCLVLWLFHSYLFEVAQVVDVISSYICSNCM